MVNGIRLFLKKNLRTINPANNKKLFDLSISSKRDVNRAVKAAKKSFVKWSKIKPFERSKYLYSFSVGIN